MTASVSESGSGGVAGYDGGTAYSEYNSSGGRRRGKRSSRRNSRRRSRKMYRGGNEESSHTANGGTEGSVGTDVDPRVEPLTGGRRRRGKTQKGKTRKGKVSKWITHVKNFSKANKMDFRDALRDHKCKATYHKMK